VAAYIELNPVRAALCADPKDYRYCGYAEALAKGCPLARQGIRTILGQPETISWRNSAANIANSCSWNGLLWP
jgi:putative transposase